MFFREVMIAVFWKKDNCILEKQELHYSGEIRIIVSGGIESLFSKEIRLAKFWRNKNCCVLEKWKLLHSREIRIAVRITVFRTSVE
jgi:hypothetical protein